MPQPSAIAREWDLKLPVSALALNRNGDWVAAALGDGSLRLFPAHANAEKARELDLHKGVSLSLQPDADEQGFLSGGDDGKVFLIDPVMAAPTLLAEQANKWIDHVASSVEGYRAYAVGKQVHLLNAEGEAQAVLPHPSSIGGLAFSPNGKRLAASHYDGVSLWWANAKDPSPTKLVWKGSHLNLVWHPDGKILLTSLQEAALHGWRLTDMAEMQMQGYAAKVHAMAFTAKGKYLASSGAGETICWPFFGGGPWGKTPTTLGGGDGGRLVTRVATHPKDEIVAAGYDDGMILLAPLDGRMEMLIHAPVAPRKSPVTGLVWNGAGDCLFASLDNGYVFLFTLESVRKSLAHV